MHCNSNSLHIVNCYTCVSHQEYRLPVARALEPLPVGRQGFIQEFLFGVEEGVSLSHVVPPHKTLIFVVLR